MRGPGATLAVTSKAESAQELKQETSEPKGGFTKQNYGSVAGRPEKCKKQLQGCDLSCSILRKLHSEDC